MPFSLLSLVLFLAYLLRYFHQVVVHVGQSIVRIVVLFGLFVGLDFVSELVLDFAVDEFVERFAYHPNRSNFRLKRRESVIMKLI